jgi:heptosyltransferase III
MDKEKIKKILFLRMEHIGDYSLSLKALKALREHFPNSKIDVVVGPWNKAFAEATPYINDIIIFNNFLVKRNLRYSEIILKLFKNLFKFRKFFKKINRNNYDLIFSLSDRKYNKIFLKFFKLKYKISGTSYPNPGINENQRIINFLEMNGLGIKDYSVGLNYSKGDKKKVDGFLKKNKLNDFWVLHPLSPLKEKNWALENWKTILDNLNKKVLVIGTEKEKNIIDKKIFGKNVINAAGKFNLVQTTYLISKSKRFLGIDSGPMHLANLVKIPILALFGSEKFSPYKIWAPNNSTDKVIKGKNINEITVNKVLKELK